MQGVLEPELTLLELARYLQASELREVCEAINGRLIRLQIVENEVAIVGEHLNQLGLVWVPSRTCYAALPEPDVPSWSTSAVPCLAGTVGAYRFVYVHSSQSAARDACRADELGEDTVLGELLGYPRCCTECYSQWVETNGSKDPLGMTVPLLKARRELIFVAPNPYSRYWGGGLISHYPCSVDCKRSREMALRAFSSVAVSWSRLSDGLLKRERGLVLHLLSQGLYFWQSYLHLNRSFFPQGNPEVFVGRPLPSTVESIEIRDASLVINWSGEEAQSFETSEASCLAFHLSLD